MWRQTIIPRMRIVVELPLCFMAFRPLNDHAVYCLQLWFKVWNVLEFILATVYSSIVCKTIFSLQIRRSHNLYVHHFKKKEKKERRTESKELERIFTSFDSSGMLANKSFFCCEVVNNFELRKRKRTAHDAFQDEERTKRQAINPEGRQFYDPVTTDLPGNSFKYHTRLRHCLYSTK